MLPLDNADERPRATSCASQLHSTNETRSESCKMSPVLVECPPRLMWGALALPCGHSLSTSILYRNLTPAVQRNPPCEAVNGC